MNQPQTVANSTKSKGKKMKATQLKELVLLDQLEIWTLENVMQRFNRNQDWAQKRMQEAGSAKLGEQVIERSRFMEYIRNNYRPSLFEIEQEGNQLNLRSRRKTA